MSGQDQAYLEECVKATEACVATMQAGIERLQPGVRDLPRLTRILQNKHHYLLLPESLLATYKAELADDVTPQISGLIERAEEVLAREAARKEGLQERLALLRSAQPAAQPEPQPPRSAASRPSRPRAPLPGQPPFEMRELNPLQRRKVVQLKNKRERLEKDLARMRE